MFAAGNHTERKHRKPRLGRSACGEALERDVQQVATSCRNCGALVARRFAEIPHDGEAVARLKCVAGDVRSVAQGLLELVVILGDIGDRLWIWEVGRPNREPRLRAGAVRKSRYSASSCCGGGADEF